MSAPRSIHLFHSSSVLQRPDGSFPCRMSLTAAARSPLMRRSNLCASGANADDPPITVRPESLEDISLISFRDIGIDLRYFPGTVLPDSRTVTSASGGARPPRIMSIVTYSVEHPASFAAPATALIMGEI